MANHHVAWKVDNYGVTGSFTCTAEFGADCRLTCAENCDSEANPCYSYDENGDVEREHGRADMGECNVLLWLNDSMPSETYGGKEHAATDGPIDLRWDSDHYEWKYLEAAS